MSVEAPKPVEETPVVEPTKAVLEQPEAPTTAPAETAATPAEALTTEPTPAATTEESAAATATEDVKKDETLVKAVPASEGVLGYKEPTLLKRFFFTKHFFWFSEEPLTAESLSTFLRSDKDDAKHASASWARETGKGLLFFSKRAEDKAHPAGVINLADASNVTKEGFNQFSFKAGSHQHRFETTQSKERDSWVVAIEKAIEEAKGLKEDITGRESYKKNVEEYSKPAVIVTTPIRSKSKEPKKSLDAGVATAAATAPAAENASTSASSEEEAKKEHKERSQSRKRGSIFGSLMGKKEEHAEKKEEKAEAKKEAKEEKKAEAEPQKEEPKATEEPSTAVEAPEAAPIAALPAVATTTDKEEATPAEKKAKRGSVFGTLFKNRVTSPTTEKSEKEASGATDVPPVSETAPKLEEPIENKPIDTAAVTAPVDTVQTPLVEEPVKEATATSPTEASAPKTEKKGGLLGFIKKTEARFEGKKEHKEEPKADAKEEAKEEKAAEAIAKDPVAAASAEPTTVHSAVTEPATETPAAPAAKEERPARDNKRRTSLFFNKKKEASETEEGAEEPKREKSPTPAKFIGNLVRRASKAVKSEGPKEKEKATEPAATTEATTSETPAAVPEAEESQIKGDVVPADLITDKPETAVPAATPEVKATA
ncbi:hypothetical protein LTS15_001548 [Exophiala xenobiotica]|nr:hypothetical protein LTS15_001548 [Exophiala xenobiotica]